MEKKHQYTIAPFTFFEFFAGGGMARLGLGAEWKCAFANDWCEKKAAAYRAYFGGSELRVRSIADLTPSDLHVRRTKPLRTIRWSTNVVEDHGPELATNRN